MSENIFNLPSGKVQNETKDVLQQIANTLGTSIDAVSRMSNVEELVSSVIDGEIQGVLNNELVATDIANKLNAKETEYAPKLTEVTTQLAQKAWQSDLEIERERIGSLISHAENTDGNSELLDIRIGYDGTTYDTAGDAVRSIGAFMVHEGQEWEVESI